MPTTQFGITHTVISDTKSSVTQPHPLSANANRQANGATSQTGKPITSSNASAQHSQFFSSFSMESSSPYRQQHAKSYTLPSGKQMHPPITQANTGSYNQKVSTRTSVTPLVSGQQRVPSSDPVRIQFPVNS